MNMHTHTHRRQCVSTCIHAHPYEHTHAKHTRMQLESDSLNKSRNVYNDFTDLFTGIVFKVGTGKGVDSDRAEARGIKYISAPSEEEVPGKGTARKPPRRGAPKNVEHECFAMVKTPVHCDKHAGRQPLP